MSQDAASFVLGPGRDPSTPVTESHQSPLEFTGKIKKVVMELKEDSKQENDTGSQSKARTFGSARRVSGSSGVSSQNEYGEAGELQFARLTLDPFA